MTNLRNGTTLFAVTQGYFEPVELEAISARRIYCPQAKVLQDSLDPDRC